MESSMNICLENIETENSLLKNSLQVLEAKNQYLTEKVNLLEKALEKEKKFHRKYAEDVVATEKIRIDDFEKEKHELIVANRSLVKDNRQLVKDVQFYQKAYKEVAKVDLSAEALVTICSGKVPAELNNTRRSAYELRQTSLTNVSGCSHKSSKEFAKVSKKLFEENKKLKMKVDNYNATIRVLKTKNQKLENFKQKIDMKKLKYSQDSNELARLVESTKTKNRTTFTPEVLAKLGELTTKYEILK